MIDIGAMIRQLRTERGLSQGTLGDMISSTKQTISNYENNRRRPDYETLEALADIFNVSISFFLTKEEQESELARIRGDIILPPSAIPAPSLSMIPVIGCVRGGAGGLACEERLGEEPAQIRGRVEDYFYLKVVGDSMSPEINDGDLALVRRQDQADNGNLVVAIVDQEEGTIKKLALYSSALALVSFNPAHPPRFFSGPDQNRVRIVGKVVQTVRKWD